MIPAPLARAWSAARRRLALATLALVLPPVAGLVALAARFGGGTAAIATGLAGLAVAIALAAWRARRLDAAWLVRRLDARREFEDSSDLLFADPARLGPLQGLQRERIAARLAARAPDLRPAWPLRALLLAFAAGAALAAVAWRWPPAPVATPVTAAAPTAGPAAPVPVRLLETRVQVRPPAYTGQAASEQDTPAVRAPEGSTLAWQLRFEGDVSAVALVLLDGRRIELAREGEAWTGSHRLDRSTLYRIEATGTPPPAGPAPLHRLEAVPDRAPEIRTLEPDRHLSLRAEGQARWPLAFEARDDHGLGAARLVVTLTQGSGEQVTVSERTIALRGEGDARARRYAHALDLAAAGLAEGDDLIVRLEVADNRAPRPQWSRSASLILRWPPPPAAQATGLDGLVQRTLPAYFRSQRQIIMDTEALLAERPRLARERFVSRSDAIGVDQRILRLRYGQFLGQEDEQGPAAPPDGDHDEGGHADDDGHGHAGEPPAPMGAPVSVLEEYGHTHDDAEAATLLDPETRALLKQALDAMWLSEGALRTGEPARALPHAYRALDFIKQVQNATRIYLARVGLELPPVDEARRMTGKREGIASRRDGLAPAGAADSPALALWRALAEPGATPDFAGFEAWVATLDDDAARLDLVEAAEAVRADPACADCRERLRARLWPRLPAAVPAAGLRAAPDAAGAAYLRALRDPEAGP